MTRMSVSFMSVHAGVALLVVSLAPVAHDVSQLGTLLCHVLKAYPAAPWFSPQGSGTTDTSQVTFATL